MTSAKLNCDISIIDSEVFHTSDARQAKQDTVYLSSSSSLRTIPLAKCRVICHCHDVTIEQTDITIAGHSQAQWRSISIEGSIDKIQSVLSMKVSVSTLDEYGERKKTLNDYLISGALHKDACGYPQFVMKFI